MKNQEGCEIEKKTKKRSAERRKQNSERKKIGSPFYSINDKEKDRGEPVRPPSPISRFNDIYPSPGY